MTVTDQPGPTKGLWAHTETLATAPAVSTTAEFAFVFNRQVSLDEVTRAVSISLASCPDQANPPAHNVALTVAAAAPGVNNAVVVRHGSEPFTPGCTYTFHMPGDKPMDDLFTCLSAGNDFSFRVRGPHEATALQTEATAIRYRPKTFDVAAFKTTASQSITLPAAVNRYAEDLGVRPFVDTFQASTPAKPSLIDSNGFVRSYDQQYLGVPVTGYGYTAVEDAAGNARSITGRNATGINLRATPTVLELVASATALASLLKSHPAFPPPIYTDHDSSLIIVSTTSPPQAPEFHLAWRIHFVELHSGGGFVVLVDAQTGAILRTHSTISGDCMSTNTSGLTLVSSAVQGSVSTFQGTNYKDPTAYFLSQYSGGPGTSYVLQTNKFGTTSRAVCGGAMTPISTTLATVPGLSGDATWAPEVTSTAASYMATQRCLDYFAAQPFRAAVGQTPTTNAGWLGFDGAGALPVGIHVGNFTSEFHFDSKEIFLAGATSTQAGEGAAMDTVCHEFGHGVLFELFGEKQTTTLESEAIDEAFGDITGAVVEHSVRKDGDWNGCHGGDLNLNPLNVANGCIRNQVHPELSSGGLTTTVGGTPAGPAPDAYLTGNYADPITSAEDVFSHRNSVIMSRWFYLLAHGGSGQNSAKCPYDLAPFDSGNPTAGWDEAYSMVFHTMQEKAHPDDQFIDIANETISATDSIYSGASDHDDRVNRVVNAWAAVNVWETFWEGKNDTIVPATNKSNVNPWAPIEWLAQDGESSWDVQIFSPDSRTLYADIGGPGSTLPAVTETTMVNGKRYAVLRLALSPNTHYFWRTRAHSTDAWTDCYPMHFFDTGDVPTVDGLVIKNLLTPDQHVRPGNIEVGWNRLEGASEYKIFVGPLDSGPPCSFGSGVTGGNVPADPNSTATSLSTVVQGVSYSDNPDVFQVQAIGPSDVTGAHPTSNCAAIDFNLATPRAPTLNSPPDGFFYDYFSPHAGIGTNFPIAFTAYDGSVDVGVTFYERDAQGNCTNTNPQAVDMRVACASDLSNVCPATVTTDAFPAPNPNGKWANPTGYCWQAFEQNGNASFGSTEQRKFGYAMFGPNTQAPGVQLASVEGGTPTNPAGFSLAYGAPVTFSWGAVSNAQSYFIEVGKWPWDLGGTPHIPTKCVPGWCIGGPVAGPTVPATQLTDTSTTIQEGADTALVSKGRYCWTVWPQLVDPDHPDQPNPKQPYALNQPNTYCYSSEPAKPTIVIDSAPTGTAFTSAPITGHVDFPYVPDTGTAPYFHIDATELPPSPPTFSGNANCTPTTTNDPSAWAPGQNFMFNDLYDCTYTFSFTPTQKTTYVFHAHAQGYASTVEADQKTITTGSCGGTGEACCEGNDPCEGGNDCVNGTCSVCGAHGQACCVGSGTACDTGFTCHDGKCLDCAIPAPPVITGPVHGPNDACLIPTASEDDLKRVQCFFTGTDHAVKWHVDYSVLEATTNLGCFVPDPTRPPLLQDAPLDVNGLFSCYFTDLGNGTDDRITEWTVVAINECGQSSAPSGQSMFHVP